MAKKYVAKADRARSDGYEFKISFTSFKNMMKAKRCKITGLTLTDRAKSSDIRFTDRTIDRIDNAKGYVKGNVAAVCHGANKLKSMFENPTNLLTTKMAKKIANFTEKGVKK